VPAARCTPPGVTNGL